MDRLEFMNDLLKKLVVERTAMVDEFYRSASTAEAPATEDKKVVRKSYSKITTMPADYEKFNPHDVKGVEEYLDKLYTW